MSPKKFFNIEKLQELSGVRQRDLKLAKAKNLDIEKIHNAFSPAREIINPQLFVGRYDEMLKGITSLMNHGGFIVIYGLRGVGKSSIAYQLKLIAEGNRDLPHVLGLERVLPQKGFNFIVHYVRCDGFVKNIPDLINRFLFGDENNPSMFSLTKRGERRLTEFKRTVDLEGGVDSFGFTAMSKGSREESYVPYVSDDLIQQFRQLLGVIHREHQDKTGILILIDEFDTIPDVSGFASLVKNCSSEFVKFGAVGIATSITELVRDHGSIARQIDAIRVPLMDSDSLARILRRAEFFVDEAITFDAAATKFITERSEGFPYFIHLLGREAMLYAFERGGIHVDAEDITRLVKSISEGRLQTIYEDIYQSSVKNSMQREVLLKAFAEHDEDEIYTDPIYSTVKELGISNPSQLMKELTTSESGTPILTKVRDRCYRFTDPVFKVYVRIRRWKF